MNFFKLAVFGFTGLMLVLGTGCRETKEGSDEIPNPEESPIDDVTIARGEEIEWTKPGDVLGPRAGEGVWAPVPGLHFPNIYFAYDQSYIGTSERPKLEKVADYLRKHADIGVTVEGHCDERGSEEYNRALGERRAISVKDYLERLGISPNRLRTVSYGEERPVATGNTPSAWAQNRRAALIPGRMK